MENNLAYFDEEMIMAVKDIVAQATGS